MWHSGDYDGLQSQRSRVQIQMSAKNKKTGGLDLRLGLELGGSMGLVLGMGLDVWLGGSIGLGIGMGLDVWLGGVNRVRDRDGVRCRVRDRDGVRAGSGCAILFEKHPPPPPKK